MWIGPTGSVSLALCNRWKPDSIFVFVNVFIDEAGTHDSAQFMILGGHVATLGQWNELDRKWGRLLKQFGVTCFHAKEMWDRQNEFAGWPRAKQERFVKSAVKIIDKHTLFGFTIRLDKADYQSAYIAGNRPRKPPLDSQYGLCFRAALSFIPEFVSETLSRTDIVINFIVEDGAKNLWDAHRIFKEIRDGSFAGISEHLGTFVAEPKRKHPGLQCADGAASSAYQFEPHNPRFLPFQEGQTVDDARIVTRSHSPVFRIHATPDVLQDMRSSLLALTEFKREFGRKRHAEITARRQRPATASEADSLVDEPPSQ